MALTDSDFLRLVDRECQNSVGFDNESELTTSRAKALEYAKGEMPDVPSLPNRSKAVSTDVADTIETILPDLVEIFTGSDDVAVFQPQNEQDEDAAEQETDYLNHVVFQENNGFLILYTMFKDACLSKTGVVTWWWEDTKYDTEKFEGKTVAEVMAAQQSGTIEDISPDEYDDEPEGQGDPDSQDEASEQTYSFTLKKIKTKGRVCIEAFAPDDFAIASDAKTINGATYCASRARPRVQDLIAAGVDADIARSLPNYGQNDNATINQARDEAQETQRPVDNESDDLRQVEVITHYIKVGGDNGELETWKVRTDGERGILIDREKVNRVNFAAITPYIVTHRFYGESVADKLMEIQRIKTALTRMTMDSGYFALNQRPIVDMTKTNDFTIGDLLRNEPGLPIRTNGPDAVVPGSAGALNFDTFGALEYFSTVSEQRTGIVRNAQGLNPDTLHDTAKGAMALMTAAQRRTRFIARVFAETGIKDMLLGVHATIRENATAPDIKRLRGTWVQVDPSTWAERNDMTISIGRGNNDHDMAVLAQVIQQQTEVAMQQGGLNGPLVTAENAYASLTRFAEKGGIKSPELYWTDPKTAPPQPPKPDPEMAKVQAQAQADQAKIQAQMQADQQKQQNQAALDQQQTQNDIALKRYQIDQELQLKREQMLAEIELKRQQIQAESVIKLTESQNRMSQSSGVSQVNIGGNPG